ncbi:hypothetical protein [Psychrobacillus sp. BM2]
MNERIFLSSPHMSDEGYDNILTKSSMCMLMILKVSDMMLGKS